MYWTGDCHPSLLYLTFSLSLIVLSDTIMLPRSLSLQWLWSGNVSHLRLNWRTLTLLTRWQWFHVLVSSGPLLFAPPLSPQSAHNLRQLFFISTTCKEWIDALYWWQIMEWHYCSSWNKWDSNCKNGCHPSYIITLRLQPFRLLLDKTTENVLALLPVPLPHAGLQNPVDALYHLQPLMFLSLFPLYQYNEGRGSSPASQVQLRIFFSKL